VINIKNNLCFKTVGLGAAALLLTSAGRKNEPPEKPNFIIIFTDDHGYGDLGCYGSPVISTPNIDRMASEGIKFNAFYAAPFSGPSRAQIMTGSYPARAGHAFNPSPNGRLGLHPDEVTIAEVLKVEGYSTMAIGKWHLGDAPEFMPTCQGFDTYFGIPFSNDMWRYHPRMPLKENEDSLMKAMRDRAAYTGFAGQGSYYPERGGFPNDLPLMRDTGVIEKNPDQRQLTTRYTEEAIKFISKNQKEPFFLYLAHSMPHVPLFVSEKYAGTSLRGLYGDVVAEIDWSVGQILAHLKKLKLDKNTLVVFTTDNGPWLEYGIDGGSAGPLRSGKGSLYEGGVRVPAIFRWPGKIEPGRQTSVIAGNFDLMPTLAYLAGAELPKDRTLDGLNIWPVLSGDSDKSPHQYFHYMLGSQEGNVNYQGIRNDKWKLMFTIDKEGKVVGKELYEINADISEKFNRFETFPGIVKELNAAAQTFYDEISKNTRPTGHRAGQN